MDIQLRQAGADDVDFARSLYFQAMRDLIESELGWDQRHQEESFLQWFTLQETAIIVVDGRDVGWMQTRTDESEIFLGSLYVIPEMQRQGIGTGMLRKLMTDGECSSKAVTLAVMKKNPALQLYERLGFRITHEDQHKFYMRAERPGYSA